MGHQMTLRESHARQERAFLVRATGRSWKEVAEAVGYASVGAAQLAVKRHCARADFDSPETSRHELIRSARMTSADLHDRFAAAVAREDDDTAAMINRELCRNRDQLAKLQGAYPTQRAEVDVTVSGSVSAIIREARERLLSVVDGEVINVSESTKGIEQ